MSPELIGLFIFAPFFLVGMWILDDIIKARRRKREEAELPDYYKSKHK
jgi:hypothetical protein